MPTSDKFNSSVFINCPFDDGFKPIFHAIVFTVLDCGFIPRHAKESDDSDEIRIQKIENLISKCRYGVHDISMVELDSVNNLPRFNMPLELGLFLGCKWYGQGKQKKKSCLILDKERYRYQMFISDIAGQDIRQHSSLPESAAKRVRDYLTNKTRRRTIPSSTIIWGRFQRFQNDLPVSAQNMGWDVNDLSFMDTQYLMQGWLHINAP
jgi:hypothetical protein